MIVKAGLAKLLLHHLKDFLFIVLQNYKYKVKMIVKAGISNVICLARVMGLSALYIPSLQT